MEVQFLPAPHGKRTYINGKWIFTTQDVRQVFKTVTNPDGTTSQVAVDPYTARAGGPVEGLTSAAIVREIPVTHANGTTSRVGVTKTGQVVSSDPRLDGINVGAFPRVTNGFKVRDNGDGTSSLVPVTTTSGPLLPRAGGPTVPTARPTATPANGNVANPPYPAGPAAGPAAGRTGVPAARVTGAAIPFGTRSIPPGQRILRPRQRYLTTQ
jgi:hypothetical protein